MPRQIILSALEREVLLAPPANRDELIRWHTFSELDLALVRQRWGDANRLGFAVQLCLLRYPGQGLAVDAQPSEAVLEWISQTLRINPSCWPQHATREETRREHLLELRAHLWLDRPLPQAGARLRTAAGHLCGLALDSVRWPAARPASLPVLCQFITGSSQISNPLGDLCLRPAAAGSIPLGLSRFAPHHGGKKGGQPNNALSLAKQPVTIFAQGSRPRPAPFLASEVPAPRLSARHNRAGNSGHGSNYTRRGPQ